MVFKPLGSDPYDVIERQDRELVVAAERIQQLRVALVKYGQHAPDCRSRLVPPGRCLCGFDAALDGGREE